MTPATKILDEALNRYLEEGADGITITGGKISDHEYLFDVDVKTDAPKKSGSGLFILGFIGLAAYLVLEN